LSRIVYSFCTGNTYGHRITRAMKKNLQEGKTEKRMFMLKSQKIGEAEGIHKLRRKIQGKEERGEGESEE